MRWIPIAANCAIWQLCFLLLSRGHIKNRQTINNKKYLARKMCLLRVQFLDLNLVCTLNILTMASFNNSVTVVHSTYKRNSKVLITLHYQVIIAPPILAIWPNNAFYLLNSVKFLLFWDLLVNLTSCRMLLYKWDAHTALNPNRFKPCPVAPPLTSVAFLPSLPQGSLLRSYKAMGILHFCFFEFAKKAIIGTHGNNCSVLSGLRYQWYPYQE